MSNLSSTAIILDCPKINKKSIRAPDPDWLLITTKTKRVELFFTLFAVAFAVVLCLEVVGVAAVALVFQLAALASDRIVVPVVKGCATTGRSVAFVWWLNAREC